MTLRNQNRNTNFFKSENILHVMDLNRYKFSIEAKNKQASAVFIKVVAQTLDCTKSWCV